MIAKLEQQGREIFQWGEEFVDITTLENLVYEAVLRWGREIMRRCLEETTASYPVSETKRCIETKGTASPRSRP